MSPNWNTTRKENQF